MRFSKLFLSLAVIFLLSYGVYTFIDYKQITENEDNIAAVNNQLNQPDDKSEGETDDLKQEDNKVDEAEPNEPNPNTTSEDGKGSNNVSEPIEVDEAFSTSIENIAMIVNGDLSLPEGYKPDDLVYPDVRFIFDDKVEKRMLREEAAHDLEAMFEAAESDGIYLAGVSGYRSHETQTQLFNFYVDRDGYEKARTYSAIPGTSEHQTGLAIDISGSTGKCAAQDCFADTAEAVWLAGNSAEYGFIIRYPKGKEDITGYKYEPWHLRYVGKEVAKEIVEKDITLEEYYNLH